jgi:hypothetical protein
MLPRKYLTMEIDFVAFPEFWSGRNSLHFPVFIYTFWNYSFNFL